MNIVCVLLEVTVFVPLEDVTLFLVLDAIYANKKYITVALCECRRVRHLL